MSGFPRPVFAGDFQAVKFYDLTPPNDRIIIPSTGVKPLATVASRNIVKGHLYEVVFGPFTIGASANLVIDAESLEFVFAYSINGAAPVPFRRMTRPLGLLRDQIPALSAYFVAPETGNYTVGVGSRRVNPGLLSIVGVSLDNSIIGIRGVASPETDFTIVNTPEV